MEHIELRRDAAVVLMELEKCNEIFCSHCVYATCSNRHQSRQLSAGKSAVADVACWSFNTAAVYKTIPRNLGRGVGGAICARSVSGQQARPGHPSVTGRARRRKFRERFEE